MAYNINNSKIFTLTTVEAFGPNGVIKGGPQYRIGFRVPEDVKSLIDMTLSGNRHTHILEKDFNDEKRGYKQDKGLIVVMDVVDYCKTIFGKDLIKIHKKDDKKFVETVKKIISLIKDGKLKEVNKFKGKYFVTISGNSRCCLWTGALCFDTAEVEKETLNEVWNFAIMDFNKSLYNFDLTEDFSKKSYERTILTHTLELIFRISEENKLSKNLIDENKYIAFDYISKLLQEYVVKVHDGKDTFIENLMLIKSLGVEDTGIRIADDLLKGSIFCSLEKAFEEGYVKRKFKGIDETQSKEISKDKDKKIIGNMADAAAVLAGKIRLCHEDNANFNKNLLEYAGLDLNLNLVNSENLLSYLDLVCKIKNLSDKASTQRYLNKVIEIPDFFEEDKVTKGQWAIFEDRAFNNAMEAEKIVKISKKDLKNFKLVFDDATHRYNDEIVKSLQTIERIIKK